MINGLDIIILLVYVFFIIRGFNNGFISTFITLIIILASIYVAINSPLLLKNIPYFHTEQDTMIIVIISFFICLFLGLYLKYKLLKPLDSIKIFYFLDKFLGALLGMLKATLIVFGICYILMFFSNTVFVKNSKLFPYVEKYSSIAMKYVQKNRI